MKDNSKEIKRPCPRCGQPTSFIENPYRPFCSKRCKMADLGSWLKEEYKISSPIADAWEESQPVSRLNKSGEN